MTKQDAHIIVACVSGRRTVLATKALKKMGYTNVVNMVDGFNEWSKQGFPVEDRYNRNKMIILPIHMLSKYKVK